MTKEQLLRQVIRESVEADKAAESNLSYIIRMLGEHKQFVTEILGTDRNKRATLIAAAISIGYRETGLGTSNAYNYGLGRGEGILFPLYSRYVQNYITTHPLFSLLDPSVGVTQTQISKFDKSEDMMRVAAHLDKGRRFLSGWDLDDPFTAILATAAHLEGLYDKAVSIGYSTTQPGVGGTREDGTPRVWTSTGNAALDLAITAYNSGDGWISNYCGEGWKKEKCSPGDPRIIDNYIPYVGDKTRNTMFYVTAVAGLLPGLITKVLPHV